MVDSITLNNGLRVVFDDMPFVRSVCFGIWIKNGSRNEMPSQNGISHFIEHMLFKGTEKRTAAMIAEEMDAVGGQMNAFTSKEHICVYAKILDTHFDTALDVCSDMFFNSVYSQEEIDKEKGVVFEEISMNDDSPDDVVVELLHKLMWPESSIGYPVLGTKDTVSTFTNKSLMDYVCEHFVPQNIVVSVSGNFDKRQMLEGIAQVFSSMPERDFSTKSEVKFSSGISKKSKDIEQVHLCMGFPSVSSSDPLYYNVSVMNTILGGGMSSKLFQRIREQEGLCYSVYSHNSFYSDTGLFMVYAGTGPSQVERVYSLVLEEINSLKKDVVSQTLLDKSKEQLKSNLLLSLESTSSRMSRNGKSLLMHNRVLTPDELIEKIDAVTTHTLNETANHIFDLQKMGVAYVGAID